MNKLQLLPPPFTIKNAELKLWRAIMGGFLPFSFLILNCISALAQVINASPPERMTYQGFLADGNGAALATNGPANYNVVFRIMDAQTGGSNLWAEQQTVTVDKGYFSVLLGEGSAITSPAEPHPAISALFAANNASDRFMEMTVKAPSPLGTADVKILPRLRLLPSPYAFLAQSAVKLVNSTSGADLVTSSGNAVTVNGTLNATTINAAGLTGLTAAQVPNLDGSKITGNLDGSKITGFLPGSKINGTVADSVLTGNVARRNAANYFSGTTECGDAAYFYSTANFYGASSFSGSATFTSSAIFNSGVTTGTGASQMVGHAPVVYESKTTGNQSAWSITAVDFSAFVNRLGGFKIRIYAQRENGAFDIRIAEGTIAVEQAGYTTGNTSFPNTYQRACVAWNDGYGTVPFTLGTGGTFNGTTLLGDGADYFRIYDYNPLALTGGTSTKFTSPYTYVLFVAFNPVCSGRVVLSDN